MNDTIRDLVLNACNETNDELLWDLYRNEATSEVVTKFAELIAKECIVIIKRSSFSGFGLAVKEIKQQFGVG